MSLKNVSWYQDKVIFFSPHFLEFYIQSHKWKGYFFKTFFIDCESDAYKYNQLIQMTLHQASIIYNDYY